MVQDSGDLLKWGWEKQQSKLIYLLPAWRLSTANGYLKVQ